MSSTTEKMTDAVFSEAENNKYLQKNDNKHKMKTSTIFNLNSILNKEYTFQETFTFHNLLMNWFIPPNVHFNVKTDI